MKLTIKTQSQDTFELDVEPEKTIRELKELIEKDRGSDYPHVSQKLVYNGNELTDDIKLSDYQSDEEKPILFELSTQEVQVKIEAPDTGEEKNEEGPGTSEQAAEQQDQEVKQELKEQGDEEEEEEEEDDDDEDDVKVRIDDFDFKNVPQKQPQQPKPAAPVLQETIVDINTLEDKPWRQPGADINDYFNYGFDEVTWKIYCDKQKKTKTALTEIIEIQETYRIPVVNTYHQPIVPVVQQIPVQQQQQQQPPQHHHEHHQQQPISHRSSSRDHREPPRRDDRKSSHSRRRSRSREGASSSSRRRSRSKDTKKRRSRSRERDDERKSSKRHKSSRRA